MTSVHDMEQVSRSEFRKGLLLVGALAGPLYICIGTAEALVRDGFDITHHSLSLLSNGEGGWIHMAMMVTTGLMTVAGAVGLAASFPAERPSRWVPRLIGLFGLGISAAGLMTADPAFGFPVGTPDTMPKSVTWHGLGHLIAGSGGFLGLIAAAYLMWRWWRVSGGRRWAYFSLVTSLTYLVTFVGIATGGGSAITNLAFTAAVIMGWVWVTAVFARATDDGGLR